MRCFYHPERSAVGICSSCHRGLCDECAKEIGKSYACIGNCEEDVAIDEVQVPTKDTIRTQERSKQSTLMVFGFGGLLILSWSVPAVVILHSHDARKFLIFGSFALLIAGLALAQQYSAKHRRQGIARRFR